VKITEVISQASLGRLSFMESWSANLWQSSWGWIGLCVQKDGWLPRQSSPGCDQTERTCQRASSLPA
jgi:hypothetical protein